MLRCSEGGKSPNLKDGELMGTPIDQRTDDWGRDAILRKALAIPPITNEEILRWSSQQSCRPRRVKKPKL
tara:strand:- start:107 stop:316 length:210 start_codon:yes stop_codon:yes gene_type:complete